MPEVLAILSTLSLCLFLSLFFLSLSVFPKFKNQPLLIPAIFTLVEWVRSWIFTGFPWLTLGYSQVEVSPLAGYIPITGIYGVSFLLILTSHLLFLLLLKANQRLWIILFIITIWGGGHFLKKVEWTEPNGSPIEVTLLQGNVKQDEKWDQTKIKKILNKYESLILKSNSPLTVLPETSIPLLLEYIPSNYLNKIKRHMNKIDGNLILGVIVGGRLGYVLFYNLPYYLENPLAILRVWDGGMAFHGGFLGVVLVIIIYCTLNSVSLWSCADLIALSTPPGLFFGRIANFINAELWGKPTDLPWGVVFPGVAAQDCIGVIGLCARHPSQLYEATLEGLLLFLVLILVASLGGLKRPGFITGVFAIGYGLSRFLIEYLRVPDSQFVSESNPYGFVFQFGELGTTMGQTLSLPMIMLGFLMIFLSARLVEKS